MRNKIKFLLKEVLGVPENIFQTSEEIYDIINKKIKTIKKESNSGEYSFSFQGDFKIAEYKFNKVDFKLITHKSDKTDKIIFLSAMVERKASFFPDKPLIKNVYEGVMKLTFEVVLPEDKSIKDLPLFFEEDKKNIIRIISHELKHDYDSFKKPISSYRERSDYSTYSGTRFGLKPLDEFLHFCYFITLAENLVRPTEVAYLIKADKIKREEFINFLESNETYQMLKKIRSFSVEGFKEDLKNYDEQINSIFRQLNLEIPKNLDEKIDQFLNIFWITLKNRRVELLSDVINSNVMGNFLGLLSGKNQLKKYLDRFISSIEKFKNVDDFLEYEEKRFKFVTNKMMRKISKLYAMTNESIHNWDLYQQIKNPNPVKFIKETEYSKKPKKK